MNPVPMSEKQPEHSTTTPTHSLTTAMRICKRCGIEKPLADYHAHKSTTGGRKLICKVCRNADRAALRTAPESRQRERVLRRQWYDNGGREIVRRNTRAYRERTGYPGWSDPAAQRSRAITQSAIRSGRLIRKSCEVCGEPKTHAHHDDYTKPLEVRWLCPPCHMDWHGKHQPIRALQPNTMDET